MHFLPLKIVDNPLQGRKMAILNRTTILRITLTLLTIVPPAKAVLAEERLQEAAILGATAASRKFPPRFRRESRGRMNAKVGPNFSGLWGGRYRKVSERCSTPIDSFNFRHGLNQVGASAYLATNHDGAFSGRSRDRGRRLEFTKTITARNGLRCGIGIVYKDLARNQRSTATGYAIVCANGCGSSFGGYGVR